MMKANKALALVLTGAAAVSASAGYNEYTSTVTDGIKDVTLTANETIISDKLSGEGVDALRFTRSSNFYTVKLRSTDGNDLPGGIIANGYNLMIQDPNVLGTGPVLLTNDWSSLQVDWGACDVLNRVIFGSTLSSAYGQGSSCLLTLHNIGVGVKNSPKSVLLGRDKWSSSLCLALDGAENDPVGFFKLRDRLALTLDGGTLRAAADVAVRDLFQRAEETETPPVVKISNKPLTVETAGGSAVRLGVVPTFAQSHTNETFQEEYKTDDWSFENGIGEWKFVQSELNTSFQTENGKPYDTSTDTAWTTTNGSKYVMLRLGAQVYRDFNVPTTGKWKVVFERGCRPDSSYSMNMATTVYVDDTAVCTFPALTKAEEKHPFKEFSTDLIDLSKGLHKIAIGIDGTGSKYSSFNFDAIRLWRYAVEVPANAIVKTGEGAFVLNDVNTGDLTVTAEKGMLACENTVLPNAAISVASGAEFDAAGLSAAGATIDVAAGGRISFRSIDLIVNGSFETPVTANYGWHWPSECKWTLAPQSDPRPGIQLNGGTYTPTYNKTPYGTQMLFLRSANSASQTITVPKDGTYELSYWACARKNYPSLTMTVTIDDTAVVTGQTLGADEYVRTTREVELTKGEHTLKFETAEGGHQYALMFIDNVSLVNATVLPSDLSEAQLSLKSGSIVRLDNAEKVVVGSATVDGVEVNGGAATLRRAGVIVEGEGRIQCGTPRGLILLVR